MESDFLREYGLDLSVELETMSWRRFLALLRGLSPNAATVSAILGRVEMGRDDKPANLVEGAKNADRAFDALFKPVPANN